MRTFGAGDGVPEGEEGEGAFERDALALDGDLVRVCGRGTPALAGASGRCLVGCGGCSRVGIFHVREPSGGVWEGWDVVAGVFGVVDDAVEADIGVVRGVSIFVNSALFHSSSSPRGNVVRTFESKIDLSTAPTPHPASDLAAG